MWRKLEKEQEKELKLVSSSGTHVQTTNLLSSPPLSSDSQLQQSTLWTTWLSLFMVGTTDVVGKTGKARHKKKGEGSSHYMFHTLKIYNLRQPP